MINIRNKRKYKAIILASILVLNNILGGLILPVKQNIETVKASSQEESSLFIVEENAQDGDIDSDEDTQQQVTNQEEESQIQDVEDKVDTEMTLNGGASTDNSELTEEPTADSTDLTEVIDPSINHEILQNIEDSTQTIFPEVLEKDNSVSGISDDYVSTTDFLFDETTNTITGFSSSLSASKDIVIPAMIGEHEVLHIGTYAFSGQQIKSLSFEEGSKLISIGTYAFYNNLTMTGYVHMPDTLTSIGSNAFNLTKLTAIFFNNDTTYSSIGVIEHNMNGSGSWSTVGIETALVYPHMTYDYEYALLINNNTNTLVRHYPEHIAGGCTKIVIPDGVEHIFERAFYNDLLITEITFPSSLQTIGTYAFYYSNVTDVELNHTQLTSIGSYAFAYAQLSELELDKTKLTSIGELAFTYSQITGINLPTTLETVGASAFSACKMLSKVQGFKDTLVKDIQNSTFLVTSALTSIELPEDLETIGTGAFSASGIEYILIPKNIVELSDSIFSNCSELLEVVSVSPITKIGSSTFASTTTLAKMSSGSDGNFFEEVTYIAASAFNGCGLSIDITLPNLVSLASKAFYGNRFTGIHVTSQEFTTVVSEAFYASMYPTSGSRYLERLTLPESLQSISGTYAFASNWYLNQINLAKADGTIIYDYNGLPEGITDIPTSTFAYCRALTEFYVPDSVLTIGASAFSSCTNLSELYLSSNIESVGASSLSSTTNVYIDLPTDSIETASAISSSTWVIWNDNHIAEGFDEEGESYGLFLLVLQEGDEDYTLLRTRITQNNYYIPHVVYDVDDLNVEYKIYRIKTGVFSKNYSVTSLEFEEGITHYEEQIAYQAQSISKIIIPDGIEYMEDNALQTIQTVQYLSIGEGLVTLPSNCVPGFNYLKTLILPDSLRYIKSDSFYGTHTALTSLTLNSRVEFLLDEETGTCNFSTGITQLYLPAYSSAEVVPGLNETAYSRSTINIIYNDSHMTDDGKYYYNIDTSTLAKLYAVTSQLEDGVLYIPEEVTIDGKNYIPTRIHEYFTYTTSSSSYNSCAMTEINVPANIEVIDENAFTQRSNVTDATIIYLDMKEDSILGAPWGNSNIGVKVLWIDSKRINGYVYKTYENKQIYITYYLGSDTVADMVSFNSYFDTDPEYEIVAINKSAFLDVDTVKEIMVPDTVQYIGDYAFAECDKLEYVTLPESMPEDGLGDYVFNNCPSLKEIRIPDGIVDTGINFGYNCGSLEYVSIPRSVEIHGTNFLGGTTFYLNTLLVEYLDRKEDEKLDKLILSSYHYPDCNMEWWMQPSYDKGTHYPTKTFQGPVVYSDRIYQDGYLYSITRESVIGHYDFEGSRESMEVPAYFYDKEGEAYPANRMHLETRLLMNDFRYAKTIQLPETLKVMDKNVFNSSSLETLKLPEGLVTIGDSIFASSSKLVTVEMPTTLESISSSAFQSCTALENVTIGFGVQEIGSSAFEGCTSLESIWIPLSVETVNNRAFYNCTSLKHATMNEGLETLEAYVFTNSGLEQVSLPDTVSSIGTGLFSGSELLETIYVGHTLSNIESISSTAFSDLDSLNALYIGQYRGQLANKTTAEQPWGADYEIVNVRYLGEYVSFSHMVTQVFPASDHFAPAVMSTSEELEVGVHFDIDIWAFCEYNNILEIQLPEDEEGNRYSFYPSSKNWNSSLDPYTYEVNEYGTYTFVGFDEDQEVGTSYHIFVEDWSLPIVYADDVILSLHEAANITSDTLLEKANADAVTVEGYGLRKVLNDNDVVEVQSLELVGDSYVATLSATDYRYLTTTVVQFNVIIDDVTPPYIFGEKLVVIEDDVLENLAIHEGEDDELVVEIDTAYVENQVIDLSEVWAITYFDYYSRYLPDEVKLEDSYLLDIKVETDLSDMYDTLIEDGRFEVTFSAYDSDEIVYHTTTFRYYKEGEDPDIPLTPLEPSFPIVPDVDPEDPTDPEDPENPTEPEEPTDPEDPTEPEEPIVPEGPTEPEKPTVPEDPTEPEEPTDPDDPSDPTESEDEPSSTDDYTEGIPKTGDETNTALYMILMIISISFMPITRKRK